MSKSFKSIPIQYHIRTTSDWTTFQIVEGGFWSDIKVECLKGENTLTQEITFSNKRIEIHKKPRDESLVEARVNCKLNIYEDYLLSEIRYLNEKGDIEGTIVRALFKGKEVYRLENIGKEAGSSPQNPKFFSVPVAKHPPTEPFTNRLLRFFKIVGLFVSGYLGILIVSLAYCYWLTLDFSEFARSNPHVVISGGAALSIALIYIGLKENWI